MSQHYTQIQIARQLAKSNKEEQLQQNYRDALAKSDADLYACMNVKKTHISNLTNVTIR